VAHQTAFQVSGFVAVDVATLGQTVNHANYFRQESLGSSLVFQLTQVFNSRAGRFFVVAIFQTTLSRLADAFKGGLVMCHILQQNGAF
jgi:hypothetical protein